MRKVRFAAIAAATALVSAPVMLHAETIATLLAAVDKTVTAEGYEVEGWSQTGSLTAKSERTFSWEPSRGKGFVLVGVCDEGCDDLDISVEDEDGDTVGEDDEKDDTPVVELGRLVAGDTYTVRVSMPNCEKASCRFAVRSYRK